MACPLSGLTAMCCGLDAPCCGGDGLCYPYACTLGCSATPCSLRGSATTATNDVSTTDDTTPTNDSPGEDICRELKRVLPSECKMSPDCLGASCEINLLGVETIGVSFGIHQCDDPVRVGVRVNDSSLGIDWKDSLSGQDRVGVPDLSITVPVLGSAGVFINFDIAGSKNAISPLIGIQACIHAPVVGWKCLPDGDGFVIVEATFNTTGLPCINDDVGGATPLRLGAPPHVRPGDESQL